MTKKDRKIEAPIIVPSVELKALLDLARRSISVPSYVSPLPLPEIGISDDALAAYLDSKPSTKKAMMKDAWRKTADGINNYIDQLQQQIPDKISSELLELLFKVLYQLVDQLVTPFDDLIVGILETYNKIIRIYRKLTDPNLGDEIKKKLEEEGWEILRILTQRVPYVADILAIIMLIDTMKVTVKNMRDYKKASAKSYETTVYQIKATQEFLNQKFLLASEIITTIVTILDVLLPIILALSAISGTSKKTDIALAEAYQDVIEEANSHIEKQEIKSEIQRLAENNQLGFSYTQSNQPTPEETEKRKISIPIGAVYQNVSMINGYGIWESVGLPNITTKTVDLENPIECFYETGQTLGKMEINDSSVSEIDIINNKFDKKTLRLIIVSEKTDFCHNEIDYGNMCPPEEPKLPDETPVTKMFLEIYNKEPYSWNYKNEQSFNVNDILGTVNGVKIYCPFDGTIIGQDKFISVANKKERDVKEYADEIQKLMSSIDMSMPTGTNDDLQRLVDNFDKLNKTRTIIRDYLLYTKLPDIPLTLTVKTKRKQTLNNLWNSLTKKQKNLSDAFQKQTENITGKDHVEKSLKADETGGGLNALKSEIEDLNNTFYKNTIDAYEHYLESQNVYCDQESIKSFTLLPYYQQFFENMDYDDNNEYVKELFRLVGEFISDRQALESLTKDECIEALNEMCKSVLKSRWTSKKSYLERFDEVYQTETEKDKREPLYKWLCQLMDCTEETQQTVNFTSLEDLQRSSNNYRRDDSKDELREKLKNICRRYFLVKTVKDTKLESDISTLTEKERQQKLIDQTKREKFRFNEFYKKIITDYNEALNGTCEKAFADLRRATITKLQDVYYNGEKYEHYFIESGIIESDNIFDDPVNIEMCDLVSAAHTKTPPTSLKYWLLYCTQATLVHCMLPMYWSTGFVASGAPIQLPVIYVPLYYIGGSVSILLGLGICGIYIYPMILFVNYTIDTRSIIAPINTIIDCVNYMLNDMVTMGKNSIKELAKQKYDSISLQDYDKQIEELDIKILDLKEAIGDIGQMRKERRKRRKEDKNKETEKENSES